MRPDAPGLVSRRRALALMGVALTAATLPRALWARELKRVRWSGPAFGTFGAITLFHDDEAHGRAAIEACVAEIARLEHMVSLYRADSLINGLNRDGRLLRPPAELVALLLEAQSIGALTDGAFDITVQPLWQLYAAHFSRVPAEQAGPSQRSIENARSLVDYRALDISATQLRLARPGMALTLNGIAQGWITDRIADRMRDLGFTRVLVDLGEIRAIGGPWHVAVQNSDDIVELKNGALAASSASGTVFEPSGRFHHLFDPATGQCSSSADQVIVRAASAMRADALATALAVLAPERRAHIADRAGVHAVKG